jgi:HAD superfamily hydrolase (TIGR01509 family)
MDKSPFCLLFDLDGTIVDTDRFHFDAYNIILKNFNRSIDWEFYKNRIMGFSNVELLKSLFPDSADGSHDWIVGKKEQIFRELAVDLRPNLGVKELIAWGKTNRVLQAIVTNAPRENAFTLLDAIGLRNSFDKIVLGSELLRGKPDPLPYLTALEQLGSTPSRAVAFEDSISGIHSATGAGILTFGITSSLDPTALVAAGATAAIADFHDAFLHNWLAGKI